MLFWSMRVHHLNCISNKILNRFNCFVGITAVTNRPAFVSIARVYALRAGDAALYVSSHGNADSDSQNSTIAVRTWLVYLDDEIWHR